MTEEKKKVYHVELDVVDSIEKFAEETGNKSGDIEFVLQKIMLAHIKKAAEKFSKELELPGVDVTNVKVMVPVYGEEKV